MIEVTIESNGGIYEDPVTGEGETLIEAVTVALEEVERRIEEAEAVVEALKDIGRRLAKHAQEFS